MKRTQPHVWFLCAAVTGTPHDLVAAEELPDHYFTPGAFFVETDTEGFLRPKYHFRVLLKGRDKKYPLRLIDKQDDLKFRLDVPNVGRFLFQARPLAGFGVRAWRYVGKKEMFQNHGVLFTLEPVEKNRLEDAARSDRLFFLGQSY